MPILDLKILSFVLYLTPKTSLPITLLQISNPLCPSLVGNYIGFPGALLPLKYWIFPSGFPHKVYPYVAIDIFLCNSDILKCFLVRIRSKWLTPFIPPGPCAAPRLYCSSSTIPVSLPPCTVLQVIPPFLEFSFSILLFQRLLLLYRHHLAHPVVSPLLPPPPSSPHSRERKIRPSAWYLLTWDQLSGLPLHIRMCFTVLISLFVYNFPT